MNAGLLVHVNELKNNTALTKEDLNEFIQKFELLANAGIHSNAIFYILNLHTLKYEYINDVCEVFTGQSANDFTTKGIELLPEILVTEDYEALSNILFPKMNAICASMTPEEQANVVFEIHYRMKHKNTKKTTTIVEYSSYSKFDEKGNPNISTGICYESILSFEGVRGIVRIKRDNIQETLFDNVVNHNMKVLTTAEKEVVKLLNSGLSRKEIASILNVSPHTINSHVKNIYRKLGINKASDLKNL